MKKYFKRLFDKSTTHGKVLRLMLVVAILLVIIFGGYLILKYTGLWEEINSIDKIRAIVESGGVYSFVIFMILQILQTTILQIPSFIVTIAGAVIFGNWPAFFMSYIAVMLGSIIMFWVGRKAGDKFLNWLVGEQEIEKWKNKMANGKYLFVLMMLFPMFPDDILCVVAGMSNMKFSFFFWTNIIARGIGIACTVFFGSGSVIPFSGWGLIVWGVIILVVLALFYLSVKYQSKIDEIVNLVFNKKKSNKKD